MNEQNFPQPDELIQSSKKTWVLIISSVIITALIVGGAVYFWQNSKIKSTEQNLRQEITALQNQIDELKQNQTTTAKDQIQNIETESNDEDDEEKQPQTSANKWETYQNSRLDIVFDYPSTWQPQEITNWGDGDFRLNFKTTELKQDYEGINYLHIVGINDKYVNEGHPGWFGYCAVSYSNINEFCKDGCERLNTDVAVDFRSVYHGDSGFSAIAYTNLSRKYPSICFEFDLSQVLSEIATEKGVNYYEVSKNYDVKSMITNREVSDSILNAVHNFKNFAKTIKLK